MTDAQLATRIAEASLIKQAEEEAKLRPAPYPFVEPVEIIKRCIVTGKKHIITVEKKGWEEFTSGESLRPLCECLPMLTEEQEQLLHSTEPKQNARTALDPLDNPPNIVYTCRTERLGTNKWTRSPSPLQSLSSSPRLAASTSS
jgi:hypothetical protein